MFQIEHEFISIIIHVYLERQTYLTEFDTICLRGYCCIYHVFIAIP